MTKRAQEPLEVGHGGGYGALNGVTIRNREGYVAAVAIADVPELDAGALARRIVACVNACAGIPTEALEAGVLAQALDALVVGLDPEAPADAALAVLAQCGRVEVLQARAEA